jgi:eukaryotic-like serine/threonine-protein kinase
VTPERLRRVEEIFHAAREREAAEREAFLADACAGDPALRSEVESLLAQPSAGVIDVPVPAFAAGLMTPSPRLAPGSSIGPYRIEGLLGSGGMGEVYHARDTILGREVAIKILPEQFTSDPQRLARFEREARLLAALNHPRVAAIYGVVDADGKRGLVLELVEGPTLADHLVGGPLPVGEALRIAHQIAEALEAAHEKGIVHRDLKPANIKIRREGVKVLDFGLAKVVATDGAGPGVSGSPTITSGGTQEGFILGTAAYMSPEQARGQAVDKRADIWAFGCVFYEMLTGRVAFAGPTVSDTLVHVLEHEPDWNLMPPSVPGSLEKLLRKCLQKDPVDRLHDIADARLEITDTMSARAGANGVSNAGVNALRVLSALGVGAAIVVISVMLLMWRQATQPQPPPSTLIQFPISLPNDWSENGLALSPDGRLVAVGTFGSKPELWLHSLASSETRAVAGTGEASEPFWSPDGSALAFFTSTQLKRVDPAGGPSVVVCDVDQPLGGSWNAEGVILFSDNGRLFRVTASGGKPSRIALNQVSDEPVIRSWPRFLPDNHHFIYHEKGRHGGAVFLGSLDSAETRHLVDSEFAAAYAEPGYLLFIRGAALTAQRFNRTNLELLGEPSLVAANVAPGYLGGQARFSASSTGVLAFFTARSGSAGQLIWFDRGGRRVNPIDQPQGVEFLNPAISPTGELVAVNRTDPETGNWDVWTVDVRRDVATRQTFNPARDADAVWSPDGKDIVFASYRNAQLGLYRKAVAGSRDEELLLNINSKAPDPLLLPWDWSPDGKYIVYGLYTAGRPSRSTDAESGVWALPLSRDRNPVRVLPVGTRAAAARLSPDGRWLAYASLESGNYEIYIQRFLTPGPKQQVSHGGGVHPRWRSDGREIVYTSPSEGLSSVELHFDGSGFRADPPKMLIATRPLNLIDSRPHYDITRDADRFLVRQGTGSRGPSITVIVNWTEKLKK